MSDNRQQRRKAQQVGKELGKSMRGVAGTGRPLPGVNMSAPRRRRQRKAVPQWVWYLIGALLFTVVYVMLAM